MDRCEIHFVAFLLMWILYILFFFFFLSQYTLLFNHKCLMFLHVNLFVITYFPKFMEFIIINVCIMFVSLLSLMICTPRSK